jgi:hypothetical protein
VGSSHRRFAIFPDRSEGACLLRSNISVELVRLKNNSSAACSLLLPPEPGISRFRRSPVYVCHYREPAPRAKLSLPTQSPRIVASRNPEEWIA